MRIPFQAVIVGVATFLAIVSLWPAAAPRTLVRDADGSLRVLVSQTDGPVSEFVGVVDPMGSPQTARKPVSAEAALLNWRAAYASHYRHMEELRVKSQASVIPGDKSAASEAIADGEPNSIIATVGFQERGSVDRESRSAAAHAEYWKQVEEDAENRLQGLATRSVDDRDAGSERNYEQLALVAGKVPTIAVFIGLFAAIGLMWTRCQLEEERQLERRSVEGDEREPSALGFLGLGGVNRVPATSMPSDLRIVLPRAWLTAYRGSGRSVWLDRGAVAVIALISIAVLVEVVMSPWGWHRFLWWPIDELAALWN